MTLQEALKATGVAEAYYDGYTICVQDDEEEYTNGYRLSIQKGGFPPHFSKFCTTFNVVQKELNDFLPVDIQWSSAP